MKGKSFKIPNPQNRSPGGQISKKSDSLVAFLIWDPRIKGNDSKPIIKKERGQQVMHLLSN